MSRSIFKMFDRAGAVVVLAAVFALSSSCASARPGAVVSIAPPGEPMLASITRPAPSSPTPWSQPRAIPKTGLATGPTCDRDGDCAVYATVCSDPPICFNGRCVGGFTFGPTCNAGGASAIDASICRNGTCAEPSERPHVCGEAIALGLLTSWRSPHYVYAEGCSAAPCLASEREAFERLPDDIGELVVKCMAGLDYFGVWSVTWDPKAPYATPFPASPRATAPPTSNAGAHP